MLDPSPCVYTFLGLSIASGTVALETDQHRYGLMLQGVQGIISNGCHNAALQ